MRRSILVCLGFIVAASVNPGAQWLNMPTVQNVEVVQVPTEVLSRYVGVYDVDESGKTHRVDVTLNGNILWLDYDGEGRQDLVPISSTEFSLAGTRVEFVGKGDGAMTLTIRYVEGVETGPRRARQ